MLTNLTLLLARNLRRSILPTFNEYASTVIENKAHPSQCPNSHNRDCRLHPSVARTTCSRRLYYLYTSNIFVVLTLILCKVSKSYFTVASAIGTHLLHALPLYKHSRNRAGQYT